VLVLLPLAVVVGIVINEAPGTLELLQSGGLQQRLDGLTVGGVNLGDKMATTGGAVVGWLSTQALAFFGGAARGLLSLVIAFFGLYFLLLHHDRAWEATRGYVPFSHATAERLRERFHSVTEATLVGTLLTAVVQGTLVGTGFWVVGLPSPAFWGVITALVSVLPIMGSALVWGPGVVILALDGRWGAAGALAAIGFVAANLDNVVRMVVFKRVSNIHPMVTLVGAFAGLKYFGLLGVLLGPLAIAYFFELLTIYREEYVADAPAAGPAEGNLLLAPTDSAPDASSA
ncbi:MAG TPA: AI-2E family transporter, partial [Longimicrobium sp.]|nr:AI-2E family transporter [Longimicrobium sp.]